MARQAMTTVDGGGVGVHVGTGMMRVEWTTPVELHILSDVTDARASQLRRSSAGAVQLLVGAEVVVHVRVQDATGPVPARPGEVVAGVTSIEIDDPPDDTDDSADDTVVSADDSADDTVVSADVSAEDTVVSADGIVAESDATVQSLTRAGNDVDDTIIGQPAFEVSKAEVDDDTILGQPPLAGFAIRGSDVADDPETADYPDASADTIIGAGRSRPVPPSAAAVPVPVTVPAVPVSSVLPPPLPAMPSVSASQHVNSGVSPTGARRTRIESSEASGHAAGTIAVSFPDGRVVALDRTVYVGRSPKSPRITSGLVPELVAVVSPRREVSSTHLEIQQEGRAVVVRDLGSTNGTRVRVPGAAPSLLSPGASRVVAAGTLLDLGDDVVLEIVAPTAGGHPVGPSW